MRQGQLGWPLAARGRCPRVVVQPEVQATGAQDLGRGARLTSQHNHQPCRCGATQALALTLALTLTLALALALDLALAPALALQWALVRLPPYKTQHHHVKLGMLRSSNLSV